MSPRRAFPSQPQNNGGELSLDSRVELVERRVRQQDGQFDLLRGQIEQLGEGNDLRFNQISAQLLQLSQKMRPATTEPSVLEAVEAMTKPKTSFAQWVALGTVLAISALNAYVALKGHG